MGSGFLCVSFGAFSCLLHVILRLTVCKTRWRFYGPSRGIIREQNEAWWWLWRDWPCLFWPPPLLLPEQNLFLVFSLLVSVRVVNMVDYLCHQWQYCPFGFIGCICVNSIKPMSGSVWSILIWILITPCLNRNIRTCKCANNWLLHIAIK